MTYPSTALRSFEGKFAVTGTGLAALPLIADFLGQADFSENVQLALIAAATILGSSFIISRGLKVKEFRGPEPEA